MTNHFQVVLYLGEPKKGIHAVCAYSKDDDIAIIITTYEPDINMWIDYRYDGLNDCVEVCDMWREG